MRVEGHDCVRDVGWLEDGVGDEEPDGAEESGEEDEGVEGGDYCGFRSSLLFAVCHAVDGESCH